MYVHCLDFSGNMKLRVSRLRNMRFACEHIRWRLNPGCAAHASVSAAPLRSVAYLCNSPHISSLRIRGVAKVPGPVTDVRAQSKETWLSSTWSRSTLYGYVVHTRARISARRRSRVGTARGCCPGVVIITPASSGDVPTRVLYRTGAYTTRRACAHVWQLLFFQLNDYAQPVLLRTTCF